jgi:hypothetical protein
MVRFRALLAPEPGETAKAPLPQESQVTVCCSSIYPASAAGHANLYGGESEKFQLAQTSFAVCGDIQNAAAASHGLREGI